MCIWGHMCLFSSLALLCVRPRELLDVEPFFSFLSLQTRKQTGLQIKIAATLCYYT